MHPNGCICKAQITIQYMYINYFQRCINEFHVTHWVLFCQLFLYDCQYFELFERFQKMDSALWKRWKPQHSGQSGQDLRVLQYMSPHIQDYIPYSKPGNQHTYLANINDVFGFVGLHFIVQISLLCACKSCTQPSCFIDQICKIKIRKVLQVTSSSTYWEAIAFFITVKIS